MKICSRCILDDSLPDVKIEFDENGVCNYCHEHDRLEKEYPTGSRGEKILQKLAKDVKKSRKGRYDCVVGVSGGCDSSLALYTACRLGLRPLAVHWDNGWNTPEAEENMRAITEALEVDFYRVSVSEKEMSDIYKSILKASIREADAPYDIALTKVLYDAAEAFNIKYIFNGHSFRTEGIAPHGLYYFDGKYVDGIHKQFGSIPRDTFPNLMLWDWLRILTFKRIKRIRPLYYIDYKKEDVKKFLAEKFGWKWYGGHHMENRYTIFCGNYYIPTKFKIDTRKSELSAFVRVGLISREEALTELEKPIHVPEGILEEVKQRIGFTDGEFDSIMGLPKKSYKDYPTYKDVFYRLKPLFWLFYKLKLVPKSFYIKYTKKEN